MYAGQNLVGLQMVNLPLSKDWLTLRQIARGMQFENMTIRQCQQFANFLLIGV